MEDFDFDLLSNQARNIELTLQQLSQKLQNPSNIGVGTNAHLRVNDLEISISSIEEKLEMSFDSLSADINKIKMRNKKKKESLLKLKSAVDDFEEIGKSAGLSPCNVERTCIDDISPSRSPCELTYQETPRSSHNSFSHGSNK